jgi:hypothetical protein
MRGTPIAACTKCGQPFTNGQRNGRCSTCRGRERRRRLKLAERENPELNQPAYLSDDASLMIAAGVNFKALSEFMGHSDISITLDRYGHLLPGAGDEAAELLGKYLSEWRNEAARKAALSEQSAPLEVPADLAASA